MNDLEKYIKENAGHFNVGEMPQGHKERFLQKLEAQKPDKTTQQKAAKSVHNIFGAISAIAAAFVIGYFALKPAPVQNIGAEEDKTDYLMLMHTLESEIAALSKECSESEAKEVAKALKGIMFEAVPLLEQLPDEITDIKRELILRKYYRHKTEGLKRIKEFLTENSI